MFATAPLGYILCLHHIVTLCLFLDIHIQIFCDFHKLGVLSVMNLLGLGKVMPSWDITDAGNAGIDGLVFADSLHGGVHIGNHGLVRLSW